MSEVRPGLVVYGDFNCPFSALASARVERIEQMDLARVEWRAVEHDLDIPQEGVEIAGPLRTALTDELAWIETMLHPGEPFRLRLPACQVRTALATSRYAGTSDPDRAALRSVIFAAHWGGDRRIDDPATLDDLGAGPVDADTAQRWRSSWHRATDPIVPVLVLPDGYVSRGVGALRRLGALLGG